MADLTVTRNADAQRYEGRLDGAGGDGPPDLATIAYRLRDDVDPPVIALVHTEVPESLRGEGVGGRLVRQALDDIRSRGERLLPECGFVESWVSEHPDYQDLLQG
ncbi:GNAT family N-acetyltransferase [Euzebya sp.]|uniref:GNAT family N-acetyltransferase n=1 Tax=Euzebya sp. TaxID=1971409 RepID=UPI0035182757